MPRFAHLSIVLALVLATTPVAAAAASVPTARPQGDLLEAAIAGEFAVQAGKLDEGARWYLDAARAADGDAGLAERAVRIALVAGDDARASAAVQLWRERAPASVPLRAAELTLALHRADEVAARRDLAALLGMPGPEGWHLALMALGSGKQPQLVAKLLDEIVAKDMLPRQLQAWLAFGGLAQRLDQPALAARIVDAVIARFPDQPRVALLHASQLRESGKPDQARAILRGLERFTGSSADLRLLVASEYDFLGDPAAAAAVLARGPQDDRSYRQRAALLARAEDRDALGALYQTLQGDSTRPNPGRRLLLGQVAEFLGRNADALQWYRSVPSGEERWEAALHAATVLHALDRDVEAFSGLHQLQADAAADDDVRRNAYLLEAELRQKSLDDIGELDAFARGLAAFPDDGALLYARGLAWERRDDIARAEADFRRILVAEPENVAALNALGYTLADRTERYTEALQLIDRARVADPDNPAIIDSYGWVLYRLGRNDEALLQLRRAFALQKDPEIGAHLGEVLWVTGDKDQARHFLEEARKLDPGNRALKRALARTGA